MRDPVFQYVYFDIKPERCDICDGDEFVQGWRVVEDGHPEDLIGPLFMCVPCHQRAMKRSQPYEEPVL